MINFKQLINEISSADLEDDNAFCDIIQKSLTVFGLNDTLLADYLKTGRSNVSRWKSGKNLPIPPLRKVYYMRIKKILNNKFET